MQDIQHLLNRMPNRGKTSSKKWRKYMPKKVKKVKIKAAKAKIGDMSGYIAPTLKDNPQGPWATPRNFAGTHSYYELLEVIPMPEDIFFAFLREIPAVKQVEIMRVWVNKDMNIATNKIFAKWCANNSKLVATLQRDGWFSETQAKDF